MKKYLTLIAVAAFISACSKKDEVFIPPANKKAIIKDAGLINYKAIPLADNQLTMSFVKTEDRSPLKVFLKVDTTTLATMPLTDDGLGHVSATFNYAFKPGQTYNFVVQSDVVKDSIYAYKIPAYKHVFTKKYNFQKVFSLKQSMGPQGFDLSPSRKYMFIQDDVNNVVQTSRINLQTLAVDKLDLDLGGTRIRAVSDHELLAFGNKNTLNVPAFTNDNDAVVLARYDMDTKQSTFVDLVSSGYGRISRVFNNRVLVTNSVYTAKTASLIDLGSLKPVKKYSLDDFDFRFIDEYSFGHMIYQSLLVNTIDGSFTAPVKLDDNSGLIDVDDATGYAFVSSIKTLPNKDLVTNFSVYKDKMPVYQSDYKYGRSDTFPIIYNIKNDVVTFYRHFGYDTETNIDGYYTLNLKTKEIKLIDANSTPFVLMDYQLKDGSVFSVRADGVYKLTAVN